MLILIIILAIILCYGEVTYNEIVSFVIIGYIVSEIIYRIFKKSAKKFSNTVKEEKSSFLECMDIFFGIVDATSNWVLILQILYIITTILFFLCGSGYIKDDVIDLTFILMVACILEIIMVLVSYISSKKELNRCIFAIWFMEAFAINTIIWSSVLIYIFLNMAMAWIILFVVISLIFLN